MPSGTLGAGAPLLELVPAGTLALVSPDASDAAVVRRCDGRGAVCALEYATAGHHWIHVPAVATFRLGGDARVTAVAQPGASPDAVRGTFSRLVVPAALQLSGLEVLHASAVLTPRGVVPFCAVSGTGKSTIAYALSRRGGYRLWADDSVYLRLSGRVALAVPMWFRSRLDRSAAAFLGAGPAASPADSGAPASEPVPVRALCVLERRPGGDIVRSARLGPAAAFPAVLAHAHDFGLEHPSRKRRLIRGYLGLARATPVYQVLFRGELTDLPAVLDHLEGLLADG
jgi:hypothetical protein